MTQTIELQDRLWKRGWTPLGDCWVINGFKDKDGYGQITFQARRLRAHRAAWLAVYGDIPDGMHVCHTCDNPPCVKPTHLFLGTARDNAQDKVRKGRGFTPVFPGESSPSAKLTFDQVCEIRSATGTLKEIGDQYGVSAVNVWHIRHGKSWRNNG